MALRFAADLGLPLHRVVSCGAACLAGWGACVRAEPVVVRFEPGSPVYLTDHDPSAPDIAMYVDSEYLGGGSGLYVWWPFLHGRGWLPGGNELYVEATVGSRMTDGPSDGYLYGLHFDELVAGDELYAFAEWGVAHPWVLDGAPPNNFPLEQVAMTLMREDKKVPCFRCHTVFTDQPEIPTVTPGVKYIGFRWFEGKDVRYGWAAFQVLLPPLPPACRVSDPIDCPPSVYDSASLFQFQFLAAAYETDTFSSITVGGGLCRTDMNFDARINFFDVATFMTRYAAGDPDADFSGDGVLNFFDISEFIGEFADGCAF
jgi:hypothetical protein